MSRLRNDLDLLIDVDVRRINLKVRHDFTQGLSTHDPSWLESLESGVAIQLVNHGIIRRPWRTNESTTNAGRQRLASTWQPSVASGRAVIHLARETTGQRPVAGSAKSDSF